MRFRIFIFSQVPKESSRERMWNSVTLLPSPTKLAVLLSCSPVCGWLGWWCISIIPACGQFRLRRADCVLPILQILQILSVLGLSLVTVYIICATASVLSNVSTQKTSPLSNKIYILLAWLMRETLSSVVWKTCLQAGWRSHSGFIITKIVM